MPVLPSRWKASFPTSWPPNRRCLRGTSPKPGFGEGGGYWLKAGQQSLAHSATTEAAAQLRKGLDALDGLPDGPDRRQKELICNSGSVWR